MIFLKKNIGKILAIFITIILLECYVVGAEDIVSENFSSQSSSASGSNNSIISVGNYLQYINKGNNSSIIGNYLSGYYFDSVNGFFKTNWSSNQTENVRITGSTNACGTPYGYKLGGYAYSDLLGFVDFDYNSDIFVYYCVSDSSLHGYAYSTHVGFQNFEDISFNFQTYPSTPMVLISTGSFLNNTTNIGTGSLKLYPVGNFPGNLQTSNINDNTIQGDIFEFESEKETLFYIIK